MLLAFHRKSKPFLKINRLLLSEKGTYTSILSKEKSLLPQIHEASWEKWTVTGQESQKNLTQFAWSGDHLIREDINHLTSWALEIFVNPVRGRLNIGIGIHREDILRQIIPLNLEKIEFSQKLWEDFVYSYMIYNKHKIYRTTLREHGNT